MKDIMKDITEKSNQNKSTEWIPEIETKVKDYFQNYN